MESPSRIEVFDTTLRDGEQAVGVAFNPDEKLEIALALERLGVDVIEAGFPATSSGERAGVRAVAEAVRAAAVAAMARATERDIDVAAEALAPAGRSRVHVVLATSPVHREQKLRLTRSQVVELTGQVLRHARPMFDEVEFCCEDASRTEPAFLAEGCAAAVDAGADILNIPDTVGYAVPEEYARLFRTVGVRARLSAHCHDDLGLAVANTLAAVEAGATQVECTINGIGERAGNAALEEVVAALHLQGMQTGVDVAQLRQISQLVARLSGCPIAAHKAIVGSNVTPPDGTAGISRGSPERWWSRRRTRIAL
jgi:2-isopropylmalate synthase